MSDRAALHLFDGFGVEIETMIVDAASLDVAPIADRLLAAEAGAIVSDVERGGIAWSNELVLHVVELKTNGPAPRLEPLPALFAENQRRIGEHLRAFGARLMPTAMHPWMDPHAETRLWPHDYSAVYEAFDRIFGCQGHGWSNLQSLHLNLPFAGDEEFGRLHAAIRLVLPLLPALAASSPVVEGRAGAALDRRMEAYRGNSRRIPEVAGAVIPEPAFSEAEYDRQIFEPLFRAIAPHDPDGVLHDEFLNARGAIARFSRGSIEIRVIDAQECATADLAIAAATIGVLRLLAAERWSSLATQQGFAVAPLAALLQRAVVDADRAVVDDPAYLAALGLPPGATTAGAVWRHLVEAAFAAGTADEATWRQPLETILRHGPLARRILAALGDGFDRARLADVYRRLCDCLDAGEMLVP